MTILNENTQTKDLWEDPAVVHPHSWVHISCDISGLLPHLEFLAADSICSRREAKPVPYCLQPSLSFRQKAKINNSRNMEQDRIMNSQWLKKKSKPNQTTMSAIYNHFRGRNKTTEKAGFSQNTHSDNISLPRFKTNEISLIFLNFQLSYMSGGEKNPNPLNVQY